jgi:hypothetical protein
MDQNLIDAPNAVAVAVEIHLGNNPDTVQGRTQQVEMTGG